MNPYNSLNVNSSNLQLDKLNLAAKDAEKVTLILL